MGMLDNCVDIYIQVYKQLFFCDLSEAVTIYGHHFHEFLTFYMRLEEKERNEGLKVRSWHSGKLADKIVLNSENFKIIYQTKYSNFLHT